MRVFISSMKKTKGGVPITVRLLIEKDTTLTQACAGREHENSVEYECICNRGRNVTLWWLITQDKVA